MKKIRELLLTYQAAQRVFKGHEDSAQAEYEQAVTSFTEALNQTTAALEAEFAANPSIRELERLRDAEATLKETSAIDLLVSRGRQKSCIKEISQPSAQTGVRLHEITFPQ